MLGEPTSMIRARANREGNEKWINGHYEQLKADYLNQWIAVENSRVVESDTDYKALIAKLKKGYGKAFCTIAIEYITSESLHSTILWLSVGRK